VQRFQMHDVPQAALPPNAPKALQDQADYTQG
jgi:hypothetical protein